MSQYIVCHQKRNNPRVDIRICQKKCAIKHDCEDFLSAVKAPVAKTPAVKNDLTAPLGARAVAMGPG